MASGQLRTKASQRGRSAGEGDAGLIVVGDPAFGVGGVDGDLIQQSLNGPDVEETYRGPIKTRRR